MKRVLRYLHNHSRKKMFFAFTLSAGTFFVLPCVVYADSFWTMVGDSIISGAISAADLLIGGLLQLVAWFASWVAGWATYFAAQFLDMAIEFSIDGESFQIPGIEIGWTVFRDLVNMVFIFIILYVAIMTILQLANFNTKQVLAKLVIVALLLNFSFFITGFVIDVGNATAQILYSAVTPGGSEIGATLTKNLNVSLLLDETNATEPSHWQKAVLYLMNTILFLVSAFVFFAGAFLFMIRYIVLLFVLMFSPLAFAAIILPNTQQFWSKWLHALINNTFVAPMYLLTIAIVIAIANSPDLMNPTQTALMNQAGTAGSFVTSGANAETAIPVIGTSGMFINYIVIIGLMVGALTVAKSIASSTAGMATKWAGATLGLAAGGAGLVGRRAIGGVAYRIGKSEGLKNLAASDNRFYRAMGTLGAKTANYASNASFDVRSSRLGKATGGVVGAALAAGGIDNVRVGQAEGRGGYKKVVDDKARKYAAYGDYLAESRATEQESQDLQRLQAQHEHHTKAAARAQDPFIQQQHQDAARFMRTQMGQIRDDIAQRGAARGGQYASGLESKKHFTWSRATLDARRDAAEKLRKKWGRGRSAPGGGGGGPQQGGGGGGPQQGGGGPDINDVVDAVRDAVRREFDEQRQN